MESVRLPFARLLVAAIAVCGACDKHEESASPPPPPPPPSAASARADVCSAGGGQDTDAISAPMVPRTAGGFCLDPQGEPKTYGDKGKFSMDEVCTTAFDGECDVYKRFGLERVVVLRYVDGTGAPSSVEVNLSRFHSVEGAYAMFTDRVVADGDPARATVKPFAAGAAGALSSSNAYVWRGSYLAELTFVTEDAKMTPEVMAKENERSTGAIAKEIGDHLPGGTELPPSASVLPTVARLPLGISFHPKDAPGLEGTGAAAVGYYQDGQKRWRDVAMVRADGAAAKDTFRALRMKPGAGPVKALGDEAALFVVQEAPDRAKAEYVAARKGTFVAAVGDEELVLDPATPSDKLAPLKLTKDEKIAKLAAWLAAPR